MVFCYPTDTLPGNNRKIKPVCLLTGEEQSWNKTKLLFNLLFSSPHKHTLAFYPSQEKKDDRGSPPANWRSSAWKDPEVLCMLNRMLKKSKEKEIVA